MQSIYSPVRSRTLIALALGIHAAVVLLACWPAARDAENTWDFASYYYAAQAAWHGEDPYDIDELRARARSGNFHRQKDPYAHEVHPFFYPPPFPAAMGWLVPFSLHAYRIWFFICEATFILLLAVMWLWWRGEQGSLLLILALLAAAFSPVRDNLLLGQVNLQIVLLVLGGMWAESRGRWVLGGCLVGLACMLKMSPALFVAWWLLQRRFKPAGAAVGFAALSTLVCLPVLGFELQWKFYTEVMSGFVGGQYHGLRCPILYDANHSIASVWHWVMPRTKPGLSQSARLATMATSGAILLVMAWNFRRSRGDRLTTVAQISAVGIAASLFPIYVFEHHLVWTLPGIVVTALALLNGRLGRLWLLPLAAAWGLLCLDVEWWRALARAAGGGHLAYETKLLAALCVLAANVWIGRPGERKS
ncbi:glycosyltransferase family 87 protein [Thermodesulfobacteriota bacterium]